MDSKDLTIEFLFQKADSLGLNVEISEDQQSIRISCEGITIAEIIEPNLQNLIRLALSLMKTYREIHELSQSSAEKASGETSAEELSTIPMINPLLNALTNGEMETLSLPPEQLETVKNIIQNVDIEQALNPEFLGGIRQMMQNLINGISQIPGCEHLQGVEIPNVTPEQLNEMNTEFNGQKQKFIDELDKHANPDKS